MTEDYNWVRPAAWSAIVVGTYFWATDVLIPIGKVLFG